MSPATPPAPLPALGGRDWPVEIGGKAGRLHRAKRLGLPVPEGIVVPSEVLASLLDGEAAMLHDLHARLSDPLRSDALVVRSAFSSEDRDQASLAGAFHSELDVPGDDAVALGVALCRVWASAGQDEALRPRRRDVLVQRQVSARHAGVAFTEPDFADDLVEWTAGLADGLVAGRVAGQRVELPVLEWGEAADRRQPDFLRRLQRLLRSLRRRLGAGPWDVEWADDGARCWLVQVRPVVVSPGRDEVFTVANHKEILPDVPSRLMTAVMAERAADLFGWYRDLDRGLPATRLFLEVFRGRPRINLSLLVDTMRRWGLPSRLVTASIGGGGALAEVPARPLRTLRRAPALLRMAWAQQRAPAVTRRAARGIAERLRGASLDDFTGVLDALGASYVELVHGMFAATAAMSMPLALLRRTGTLAAWSARHRTVTTDLLVGLQELRDGLRPSAADRERLAAGQVPLESGTAAEVAAFLSAHGHRGPFESDVARPRFADAPAALYRALASAPASGSNTAARPRLRPWQWFTWPLWRAARGPMAAREMLRDEAMRSFGAIRSAVLRLAEQAVQRGLLPASEAVWDLDADELRALDADAATPWTAARWQERRAEIEAWRAAPLPDLFHRRGLRPVGGELPVDGKLRGLGLTSGCVDGRAWVVREPDLDAAPPAGDGPLVLVAPAVEAGWIPLFSRVDAVVVEMGGELSHGSIVLREAGLPAITDVRGACAALRDGQRLRVDVAAGQVETFDA